MRSKIGKVLREKFDQRVKAALPDFRKDDLSTFPAGDRGYVSTSWPGFSAYLVLAVDPKLDCFYIDVACSTNGPIQFSYIPFADPGELTDGAWRFRLNRLYDPKHYEGWPLARSMSLDDDFFSFQEDPVEVALERIDPALDDALSKIKEYALPYFEGLKPASGE